MSGAVAATGQLARIEVLRPSGVRWPAVCELYGGEIPWGKRTTLESGEPHGIHRGDPEDDTGGTQVPQDSPQDHTALGYVVDLAVC